MAKYRLEVGADHPLWPDLKAYDGLVRHRSDAAFLALRKACYEAMHGEAMLDRQVAVDLMAWADALAQDGLKVGFTAHRETLGYQFRITRS